MGEELLNLTANWVTAMGLTYFGGHAIADDSDVVGFGCHCSNNILGQISEI